MLGYPRVRVRAMGYPLSRLTCGVTHSARPAWHGVEECIAQRVMRVTTSGASSERAVGVGTASRASSLRLSYLATYSQVYTVRAPRVREGHAPAEEVRAVRIVGEDPAPCQPSHHHVVEALRSIEARLAGYTGEEATRM